MKKTRKNLFFLPFLFDYTKCICDAHLRGVINFIKKRNWNINKPTIFLALLSRIDFQFLFSTFFFLFFFSRRPGSNWFWTFVKERNWDYNKMWFSIVWQVDMERNYLHCVIGADNGNIHSSRLLFSSSVFPTFLVLRLKIGDFIWNIVQQQFELRKIYWGKTDKKDNKQHKLVNFCHSKKDVHKSYDLIADAEVSNDRNFMCVKKSMFDIFFLMVLLAVELMIHLSQRFGAVVNNTKLNFDAENFKCLKRFWHFIASRNEFVKN